MKNLPIAARLVCAAIAVGVTFLLLSTVLSIASPQRDILIAKAGHVGQPATRPVAVAMATTGAETLRK